MVISGMDDSIMQSDGLALAKAHRRFIADELTDSEEYLSDNILKEAFIEQFLESRETVSRIRREFDDDVTMFLVIENFEKNTVDNVTRIIYNGQMIDEYVKDWQTQISGYL